MICVMASSPSCGKEHTEIGILPLYTLLYYLSIPRYCAMLKVLLQELFRPKRAIYYEYSIGRGIAARNRFAYPKDERSCCYETGKYYKRTVPFPAARTGSS